MANEFIAKHGILSRGAIGIGANNTSSIPLTALHVRDSTNAEIRVEAGGGIAILSSKSSGTNDSMTILSNVTDGELARITATTGGNLYLSNGVSATWRMRIDSGGNINCGGGTSVNGNRLLDIVNTDAGANATAFLRLITKDVAGSGSSSLNLYKHKSGYAILQNDEPSASGTISLYTAGNAAIYFYTAGTIRGYVDGTGNFTVGTAQLSTSATAGTLWIPSCAGTPTGALTRPYTGAQALLVDDTNDQLYRYGSGGWKKHPTDIGNTWTPTFTGWTTAPTSVSVIYRKIGRTVYLFGQWFGGVAAAGSSIQGLPFDANFPGICHFYNISNGVGGILGAFNNAANPSYIQSMPAFNQAGGWVYVSGFYTTAA